MSFKRVILILRCIFSLDKETVVAIRIVFAIILNNENTYNAAAVKVFTLC